jgi:hypothetical protein
MPEQLSIQKIANPSSSVVISGMFKKLGLRVGTILSVDSKKNKVMIGWLFPIAGGFAEVDISSPYTGLRSGIRFVPEIGSKVCVGFIGTYPILLTYALPAAIGQMIEQLDDQQGNPTYIKSLNPGEVSITSSQNSEIYFNADVKIKDSKGNSIIIESEDNSINFDSAQLYINNQAGSIDMGILQRDGEIITSDGESVLSQAGGNAYTELHLKVMEYADSSLNSSSVQNNVLADITVGTILDEGGNIAHSAAGEQIALQIDMASGIQVTFDKAGNMYTTSKSLNVNAKYININNGYSGVSQSFLDPSQQRAAREGDRISVPLSPLLPLDLVHPGLNVQGLLNTTTMIQLAASFMSPMGPCTFIPIPNMKLFGEITQGSMDVFIGSYDKAGEAKENINNV